MGAGGVPDVIDKCITYLIRAFICKRSSAGSNNITSGNSKQHSVC